MLKQIKNGGTIVIDRSHKSFIVPHKLYEILLLNTSSKKVVCFLFPKIYVDIPLETW